MVRGKAMSNKKIPNDWIPLSEIEETSEDPTGGTYLQLNGRDISLIRVRENNPNDVMSFYQHEIEHLLHKLIDYQAGKLEP